MWLGLCFGEANSKVPPWFPGDHYASGGDRGCSQHPQCSHERLPPLCSEAGHGVSVSRAGDSLSLGAGLCSGHKGGPCMPSSATPFLQPQAAKLRLEGSVPYLQQGCCVCPRVCPAVAEEVGKDVTCNLPVSLPRGSAWANMVSQYTQVILLILYMWWRKIHVKTWGGWSRECLLDWGSFVWLAVPSMIMLCVEWWTFEIGSFLAGLISVVELGAQSVIYELACVAYMLPLGISVAASVRVGNALGAGNVEQAKTSCITALLCTGVFAVVVAVLLGSIRNVVGYIFTNDKEIVSLVSKVMLIFGPFHLLDATAATCGGVLRGTGRQKLGAIANAVGYYTIGFPVGISLMFAAKMGVLGLWVGMIICISVQAISFLAFVIRMDWRKAAEEAQVRAGMKEQVEDVNSNGTAANKTSAVGYTSLDTDTGDTTVLPESIVMGERQPDHELSTQEAVVVPVLAPVAWRTVILHRVLAAAVAIAVLGVGILVRFLTGSG
uniref:Multidrug and toxin extrusion protein n=1 Tax=Ficedula albicollis TaxID=59894 RepID=A0A803V6U7_FICAL